MYGAEYDTREKWVIEAGTLTIEEVAKDSTELGNYYKHYRRIRIVRTGEDGCINNIYGLAGNVMELTQEQNNSSYCVIRGGSCSDYGNCYPVDYRDCGYPHESYDCTGFRTTFYIK